MKLFVGRDGTVRLLYQEKLNTGILGPLKDLHRVSRVEPDREGKWWSHFQNGVSLGPYGKRSEALAGEREYLEGKGLV